MTRPTSSPELVAPVDGGGDPELLQLPRPPRLERMVSVGLMIATGVLAAIMVVGLASDVRYALASGEPEDIGDLARWTPDPSMTNRFVRGTGRLGSVGGIRYDRPMERDSFRLNPVAGNDKIWVELRVPSGPEAANLPPPTMLVGRLMPFQKAALRYGGLARSVREATGAELPSDAWVLVDGATPSTSRWTVALAALFAVFAAYNLITIARIVRPARG